MRYLAFLFLNVLLLVTLAFADEERPQKFIKVDENEEGWELRDDGSFGPFVLDSILVLGTRPDPQYPGICIHSENFTLWWGGESWSVCFIDEWEPLETPMLSVLPGALMSIGDFISSDNHHTVEAVIEDIEVVEEWSGTDLNGYSGFLNFNPITGKEPTVSFIIEVLTDFTEGRGGPLSYTAKAKIGPLEATSPEFTQNTLHRLRQEYIDFDQERTPEANEFDQDAAAYYNLADPNDTDEHHEGWHILRNINARATTLKTLASNITFIFQSGYRSPARNRNTAGAARESQHIYGTAFDFDVTIHSDSLNTAHLYILWRTLRYTENLSPSSLWLYDQAGRRVTGDLPAHPDMPTGVTEYTRGHADWR